MRHPPNPQVGTGGFVVPGAPTAPVPAANAPRLVNFTGIPEAMRGNQYYGQGLANIDEQRQALAQAAGQGLENVREPFGGAGYLVNQLGRGLRENMAANAEAATRNTLASIMGGIDPKTGPTMQQVQQAYEADPAFGEKLYAQLIATQGKEHWEPVPGQPGLQRNTVTGETKKTGLDEAGGAWKPSDIAARADDYMKAAQTYNSAAPSWGSMKQAAALGMAPEGTAEGKGAADYNLIVAFAKLLDPQSVVREGEVQSASMTEGELGALQGWLNTWKKEGLLTDSVRRGIMVQANSRMQNYYDQAKSYHDWISSVAARHGVNPDDVVPPLGEFEAWGEPKQPDPNKKPPDDTTPPPPEETPDTADTETPPTGLKEGQTATDDSGNKWIVKGGKWVPVPKV